MRVVAGRLKGRRITAPEGGDVRPTADRVRQAIFNILMHGNVAERWMKGATVIDAFAGTGSMGIEALSRGAAHCTFVEKNLAALAALEKNLKTFALRDAAQVVRRDVSALRSAGQPADFAFLDPPYGEDLGPGALETLAAKGWLAAGALCVLEIGARDEFVAPDGFTLLDERRYGAARVLFLRYDGETARKG